MHAGTELERGDCGGEDIDHAEWRMIGHQVSSTFFAVLALALRSLLEHANMLCTFDDANAVRFP